VDCDLAVGCHNTRGQRGRHQREALLYATWGVNHRPMSWIRATDRRRFGIASSYRQVHQARIRTSSRKPALRLLCMGGALVRRNVWVWLHAEVLAQPQRGARKLQPQMTAGRAGAPAATAGVACVRIWPAVRLPGPVIQITKPLARQPP
jgi:hypothetical protein